MRNRGLRTGLTLLFCLAVLMGGVTPPAIQHAHAGGEHVHNHHQVTDDLPADQHGHRHSHPHQHEHNFGQNSDRIQRVAVHRHLFLFGFELFLPSGEQQNSPNEGNDFASSQVTLVRLFDAEGIMVSGSSTQWLCMSLPSLETVVSDSEAGLRPQNRREILSPFPLCDSARNERSGVQLI